MHDVTLDVSVFAAIGSFVVSIFALGVSYCTQGKANKLQQRIVEIEEQRDRDMINATQKADLRAEIGEIEGCSARLFIKNDGASEARNIRVKMDGVPIEEHPAGNKISDQVGPHAVISCDLIIGDTSISFIRMPTSVRKHPPFTIEITWEDNSGQNGLYRTTITP